MTDKPTDAVAQARDEYDYAREAWRSRPSEVTWQRVQQAWAEVLAAVRAECAAKVGTVSDCHAHCLERRANVDHIAELEAEVEEFRKQTAFYRVQAEEFWAEVERLRAVIKLLKISALDADWKGFHAAYAAATREGTDGK